MSDAANVRLSGREADPIVATGRVTPSARDEDRHGQNPGFGESSDADSKGQTPGPRHADGKIVDTVTLSEAARRLLSAEVDEGADEPGGGI